MKFKEICHSSHKQKLILKDMKEPYYCNGCGELGFVPCFQCEKCNKFHLHEECAWKKPSIYPIFFNNRELKFFKRADAKVACDACGKDIKGYMYQSKSGRCVLHPCCANLPYKIATPIEHDQYLYLTEKSKSSICLKCDRNEVPYQKKGWWYISSSREFCFHVACLEVMALECWKKKYLKLEKPSRGVKKLKEPSREVKKLKEPSREVRRANQKKDLINYFKKARFILKAILSVLFGDVIGLIATVGEQLIK